METPSSHKAHQPRKAILGGALPYDVSPRILRHVANWFARGDVRRGLAHPWLRRLEWISHYGVLPLLRDDLRNDVVHSNRLQHSIAVASLCIGFGTERGLQPEEAEALSWAGLLHDIGHTPFAHSLEPLYRESLGWDHNERGAAVAHRVLTHVGLSRTISDIVLRIIDRSHGLSRVLYGTAGLDALENIARALRMEQNRGWALVHPEPWPSSESSTFAAVKEQLYATLFFEPRYQLFERLFQAVVFWKCADEFRERPGEDAVGRIMGRDDRAFADIARTVRASFASAVAHAYISRNAEQSTGSRAVHLRMFARHRAIRPLQTSTGFDDQIRREWVYITLPVPSLELPPAGILEHLGLYLVSRDELGESVR